MFNVVSNWSKRPKSDLVVLPFFKGEKEAKSIVTLPEVEEAIASPIKSGDFSGKEGATMLIYLTGQREKRLLLLGLGEEKECSLETVRRSYAAATKRCQNKKWLHVSFVLPTLKDCDVANVTRAVSEGVGLCLYLFEEWKFHKKLYHIKEINLIGAQDIQIVNKTMAILSGVNLARDLVNRNACDVTPDVLITQAKKLASRFPSVKATVLNKKQIEKEKMGLFLAVASGSHVDPALIMIEYYGDPNTTDLTMVVGKGVTFDTGGLNLKPTGHMEDMRADMSGAAAAMGILLASASSHLKHNIVIVIPASENAIGPCSYKPGDVYRSYQGTTVEITNTDAEGRLLLADSLAYGYKRFSPTRIIDIATLTGSIVSALGDRRAGLFSNNEEWAQSCIQAGETTGERVWRMPLDSEYKTLLKSDRADIKNASTQPMAGSITAALFLKEFIKANTPWIHLDIAGTAFLKKPEHYLFLGTGSGVRLVMELLDSLPKQAKNS